MNILASGFAGSIFSRNQVCVLAFMFKVKVASTNPEKRKTRCGVISFGQSLLEG
jgi:hypothetical protein